MNIEEVKNARTYLNLLWQLKEQWGKDPNIPIREKLGVENFMVYLMNLEKRGIIQKGQELLKKLLKIRVIVKK